MPIDKNCRSHCPQNLALEAFGDKWTLLIIRDMIIEDKKYFREFLHSKEKIASNILSNRLQTMEEEGLIHKLPDPDHKQKIIYRLTEKGIDLFPILLENARWSIKYKEVDAADVQKAKAMLAGGDKALSGFMDQLKQLHLPK